MPEIFIEEKVCQFLIGNVYLVREVNRMVNDGFMCQFLIGNVYQLVLSVSNYDTTPFSSQNQSKTFKKSVDLQQFRVKSKFVCKFIFQLCGFTYATFIFKRFD